jgi:hypothetical protein
MSAHGDSSVNIPPLPIIVRPEPTGQFSAEPAGAPEIHVVAPTVDQAVAQVQQALAAWPGTVYWIPGPPAGASALPPAAGHAKDDPAHDQYLEEIERYRREVEARECSSSSTTPTT